MTSKRVTFLIEKIGLDTRGRARKPPASSASPARPHAREPPHPVALPASAPVLLAPAQASRPKTPPSFPASLRIFASARPQTLRKPRQPAARTASATCPARLAAPAPRPPEPATPAPRHSSAPIAAHVLTASSLRCRRPSSRRAARLGRSPSGSMLRDYFSRGARDSSICCTGKISRQTATTKLGHNA